MINDNAIKIWSDKETILQIDNWIFNLDVNIMEISIYI